MANGDCVLLLEPPGVGKTHLAVALGREAIARGYPVPFATATSASGGSRSATSGRIARPLSIGVGDRAHAAKRLAPRSDRGYCYPLLGVRPRRNQSIRRKRFRGGFCRMSVRDAPSVWYNRGLSQTYDTVRMVRSAAGGRLRILASHTRADAPVLGAADAGLIEPAEGCDPDAYVEWALRVCREQGVALFVPARHAEAIALASGAFRSLGVKVQVPAPAVGALLGRKDALYRDLAGAAVALPEYRVVHTVGELDAAYADLRQRHAKLCAKPTVGIFGVGFRILEEDADAYELLLHLRCDRVPLGVYREALGGTSRPHEILVMQYLDGLERSVDCIAHGGRAVFAVARRKEASCQVLELDGPAIELSRFLVARYGLDGVVNVQFKDSGDVPHLLEINARVSGGMLYACECGVSLPYWSALLALGMATPEELPVPVSGLSVYAVSACVSRAAVGADSL